jgi:putative membrane protein
MTASPQRPVLIDLDADPPPAASPATAPPVPDDAAALPQGQAMATLARLSARPPSRLTRLFWSALVALVGFVLSVTAWNFVTGLLAANPIVGWAATGLVGVVLLAALGIAAREWRGYARLARLDRLRDAADRATGAQDLTAARRVARDLAGLYRARPELAAKVASLERRAAEAFDADAVFAEAERTLLAPLDRAAQDEVAAAARQVATVTALVPLALADVVAALTSNLRMIRRIAEVYGGRAGTLGSWRLTRTVLTHLVATGAVAAGDDLIGSLAGGGLLSKLSRRFGEGLVNGALTARVGVAAMEVCRPLPFTKATRPSVSVLVKRALTGLFGQGAA